MTDPVAILRSQALAAGFARLGVAAAGPSQSFDQFRAWLDAGRHGTMDYLATSQADRRDIRRYLVGARSVVMVSAFYDSTTPAPPSEPHGVIARYARTKDYHKGLRASVVNLARASDRLSPGSSSRVFVDTAPVAEREWAARAGLGWIGKNGCLIDPEHGSWLLLGGFVTTADYSPSETPVADQCGDCRRCLDQCPTSAFVGERELDARRCVSYQTIEHRGELAPDQLTGIGERIFGCDVCQEVCPWNQRGEPPVHPSLRQRSGFAHVSLPHAARMSPEAFDAQFAGAPIRRPGFVGFARSVAAALAEQGTPADLDALEAGAGQHPEVAAAIDWARRKPR